MLLCKFLGWFLVLIMFVFFNFLIIDESWIRMDNVSGSGLLMVDELVVVGVGSVEMYFGKLLELEFSGFLFGFKDMFVCRCFFGRW